MKSINCISATAGRARGLDDRRFRDRRVDHAGFAESLLEALGDLERAAIRADVLAQHEDAIVALHLLPQALAQRLEKGDFGHHNPRNQSRGAASGYAYTPGKAVSGGGNGSLTQASVAWSISALVARSISVSSDSSAQPWSSNSLMNRSTGSLSRAQRSISSFG
jgi:hypothetical protein